jgi:hypothetical protein
MIIVVARGRTGSRIPMEMLSDLDLGKVSDVYDPLPSEPLWGVWKGLGQNIGRNGRWDFHAAGEPSEAQRAVIIEHMAHREAVKSSPIGFPWVSRIFPEAWYIHLTRDTEAVVRKYQPPIDDLRFFNIPPYFKDSRISWDYCQKIVEATPKPEKWMNVTYEDLVVNHESTASLMEDFLGKKLQRVEVHTRSL